MPLDFQNLTDTIESITHVAVALAQGQPLNEHQRKLAADVLFDYLRLIEARSYGGKIGGKKGSSNAGRKFKKNPSKATLYQRERIYVFKLHRER